MNVLGRLAAFRATSSCARDSLPKTDKHPHGRRIRGFDSCVPRGAEKTADTRIQNTKIECREKEIGWTRCCQVTARYPMGPPLVLCSPCSSLSTFSLVPGSPC